MLQRLLLLRDVAAGMDLLHSKNIVHSDLVRHYVLHGGTRR
jgi:tRNA A-37 threonylcarbamoyl transferase component Bud32